MGGGRGIEGLITQSDKAGRKETEDGWMEGTDGRLDGIFDIGRARITLFCRIEGGRGGEWRACHRHHAAACEQPSMDEWTDKRASEDQRGVRMSLPSYPPPPLPVRAKECEERYAPCHCPRRGCCGFHFQAACRLRARWDFVISGRGRRNCHWDCGFG